MPPSLLFIDEEPYFLVLVKRALTKEGYRVTTALIASKQWPKTVDRLLRGFGYEDGFSDDLEVLAPIEKRNPSTRVIMVSGYHNRGEPGRIIKLGAQG